MEIDLVYLWVDGNDPKWIEKKNHFTEMIHDNTEANCKGRYVNNDELKYSLRSAEKYAPWLRKIFIVTDEQMPPWLDTNDPKIKIIDHKEIMPIDILPCFNASVIEYFLYKIPDLSEHFLFSNDDMFFSAVVSPDFFFTKDGFPVIRLKRKPFGKLHYWIKYLRKKGPGTYRNIIAKASSLVERKYKKYYSGIPHHNIDAYKKSDYKEVMEKIFVDEVMNSMKNRTRKKGDMHRSAVSYYALAIEHAKMKYVNNSEALRIHAHKKDFMRIYLRYKPTLFCVNDDQRTIDDDRERIKPFLDILFPEKSRFEK